MEHFLFFIYLFIICAGVTSAGILYFIYFKTKDRLLYHFLIIYSAFSLYILSNVVIVTYININVPQTSFYILFSLILLILLSFSFLLYSIILFSSYTVLGELTFKRKFFAVIISLSAMFLMSLSLRINLDAEKIYLVQNIWYNISIVLIFLVIVFAASLKIYYLIKIKGEYQRIAKIMLMTNIMIFPGYFLDSYLWGKYQVVIFMPLFYISFSFLFVYGYLKMYLNKNGPFLINISGVNYEDLLNKAGTSPREREIILMILNGFSNKKIANLLFISVSTVKTHISNIFQKLNVKSRFELIATFKNLKSN